MGFEMIALDTTVPASMQAAEHREHEAALAAAAAAASATKLEQKSPSAASVSSSSSSASSPTAASASSSASSSPALSAATASSASAALRSGPGSGSNRVPTPVVWHGERGVLTGADARAETLKEAARQRSSERALNQIPTAALPPLLPSLSAAANSSASAAAAASVATPKTPPAPSVDPTHSPLSQSSNLHAGAAPSGALLSSQQSAAAAAEQSFPGTKSIIIPGMSATPESVELRSLVNIVHKSGRLIPAILQVTIFLFANSGSWVETRFNMQLI